MTSPVSSQAISVGDLVQVVRWPCCGEFLGITYRVGRFENMVCDCKKCGAPMPLTSFVLEATSPAWCVPREWLKRIPPLSELEGVKTEEDIREPA